MRHLSLACMQKNQICPWPNPYSVAQGSPEPLCTFAQSRSSPSCAGVSSISRDTCKASAETTTTIRRDAFVVLQPDQHIEVGSEPGNRTLNLAVNRLLQPVQK